MKIIKTIRTTSTVALLSMTAFGIYTGLKIKESCIGIKEGICELKNKVQDIRVHLVRQHNNTDKNDEINSQYAFEATSDTKDI